MVNCQISQSNVKNIKNILLTIFWKCYIIKLPSKKEITKEEILLLRTVDIQSMKSAILRKGQVSGKKGLSFRGGRFPVRRAGSLGKNMF